MCKPISQAIRTPVCPFLLKQSDSHEHFNLTNFQYSSKTNGGYDFDY